MTRITRNAMVRCLASAAVLLVLSGLGATAGAAIMDNLVGYWTFDGNYIDSSSLQNALSVGAGTPAFTAGQAGQALHLNGSSWVGSQNNVVVSGSQPRTLNLWLKADALQTKAPTSFGVGSLAGGQMFDTYLQPSGTFGGHFYGGGYDTFAGSPNPTYTPGTWMMGTLVYGGGTTVDVYKDGQYVKTATSLPLALDTVLTRFYAGRSNGYAPSTGFAGALDEVALWNRTLSAAEISAVYNAGQQGKNLFSTLPASSLAIQFDAFAGAGAAAGILGPGHAAGVMKGTTWNEITNHYSGGVYNENGGIPAVTATVQFAGTGANEGDGVSTPLSNWGAATVSQFNGAATGWGGVYDTALTKDTLYVSAGGRNVMGTRVSGLPAGTYDVFWVKGTTNLAMNVAIGANLSQLAGNSFLSPAFQGSPTMNTWIAGTSVQGGNYFRKRVTISGPSDNIAVITDVVGANYNDFLGLQIAKVDNPTPPTLFRVQFDTGRSVGATHGPAGPGHAVGLFSGHEWNALGASSTGSYTGSFVDESGNPLANYGGAPVNLTVQLAANSGAAPLSNWGSVTVADWPGLGGLQGINGTDLMRDALYVSVGDRNVMGIRVGGLPIGWYEVFMMPKYAGSTVQQSVAIGVNLNALGSDSLLSPPGTFDTWVEGTSAQPGNYYRKVVNVAAPGDWITMIYDNVGITSTEFMGFQIAMVGVPEPSSWALLAFGIVAMGAGARRRRATRG